MSTRVYQLLDEVREKSVKWKEQVVAERATNERLSNEVSHLNNEMEEKLKEISELQSKVSKLTGEIESMKEQSINSVPLAENKLSNEEIDALVKEIDYCIGQLKK